MKAESRFNRIYVIESLGPNDLHAGSRLYNDILKWDVPKLKALHCEFLRIKDSAALHSSLIGIAEETKNNSTYPILHMDFHGSKKGFCLESGEMMGWKSFLSYLTKTNIACRNNLLITLAACHGIYLTQIVKPTEPVPFCSLVAPTKEIGQGDIDADFKSFYEELLTSFNGDKALEKLNLGSPRENPKYAFINCINLYRSAYSNYHGRYCTGKGAKKRIEKLVTKARSMPSVSSLPIGDLRKNIKYEIKKNENKYFEKYRKVFFMIDLYPENDARFGLKFEDVITEE